MFKGMSARDKLLFAINPTAYLITKGTEKAIEKIQSIEDKPGSGLDELRVEAAKQEIMAQFQEAQARVSQELAIAQRIHTAEQVEIEEFYDTSGKGGLTANITEGAVTAGLSGEGRKVTKRIYRFTGWHEGANEVFEQIVNKEESDKQAE